MECPELNEEQAQIATSVLESKRNVFITGSAGVGKSFLIKYICDKLKEQDRFYALVAPTGVAAVNIGGVTIHRFAGLRPQVKNFADYIRSRSGRPANWKNIDVIIMDEVSMIHPDMFDMLDTIAKHHRRSSVCFGGLQVIMIGDLLQLPYVPNGEDKKVKKYLFETKTWKDLDVCVYLMTKVMRQNDRLFIQALNDLRFGSITPEVNQVIEKCTTNKRIKGKHYIKLYALNVLKDNENTVQLEKLETPPIYYKAEDKGDEKLLAGCLAPTTLVLKEGCPVMLLRNMPEHGLCNGSIGIVEGFEGGMPVVKFNNGQVVAIQKFTWEITERYRSGFRVLASRKQVALSLAYALSQHKSQGLTIDYLEVDCLGIFTSGQLYTALSRASTLKGLRLRNFHEDLLITDDKVTEFYTTVASGATTPPTEGTLGVTATG